MFIKRNMTHDEIVEIMSKKDIMASILVRSILEDDNEKRHNLIFTLDSLKIKGELITKLFMDCSYKDIDVFDRSIYLIANGLIYHKDIIINLENPNPIPFINNDINSHYNIQYGDSFGVGHEKWDEYCEKQTNTFYMNYCNILEKPKIKTL